LARATKIAKEMLYHELWTWLVYWIDDTWQSQDHEMHKFFVCNHVTFHPNDGQSNNLWTIFFLSEWSWQEKLNGNSSFESLTVSKLFFEPATFGILVITYCKQRILKKYQMKFVMLLWVCIHTGQAEKFSWPRWESNPRPLEY
jgi:hypothetical protein